MRERSIFRVGRCLLLRSSRSVKMLERIHRRAWVHRSVLRQLHDEAQRAFPNETGGVLMGYWIDDASQVVITDVVGPGPRAIHYTKSFVPDHDFQEERIARIYEESDRIWTYLGDWHTHPHGSSSLSRRDRQTLRAIAMHSEARCPLPLMAILAGGREC